MPEMPPKQEFHAEGSKQKFTPPARVSVSSTSSEDSEIAAIPLQQHHGEFTQWFACSFTTLGNFYRHVLVRQHATFHVAAEQPDDDANASAWEQKVTVIELEKGERGLGFSILDFQVRT